MFSLLTLFLLISITQLFLGKNQASKTLAYGSFIVSSLFFATFILAFYNNDTFSSDIQWLKNLSLSLSYDKTQLPKLLPIIAASFAIGFANIKRPPQISIINNAFINCFVILLIFLICAENIIQVLIGSILISAITTLYIKDASIDKKPLIYYSFVADSLMFISMTILWAETDAINIADMHKSTIPLLLKIVFSISLFIKLCFFGVNRYAIELKKLNETDLMSFIYLSLPISGMLIYSKLSFLTFLGFNYIALAFAFLYLLFFIKEANLNLKILNFSLAAISFCIYFNDYSLLLSSLLIVLLISIIIIISSFEKNILLMGGYINKTKIFFAISILISFAYIANLATLPQTIELISFEVFAIFGIALILRRVFISAFSGFDEVFDNVKNPSISLYIPIFIIIPFIAYSYSLISIITCFVFVALCFLPIDVLIKQTNAPLHKANAFIEKLLIIPLRFLGRTLWLVIDFLLIKRAILKPSFFINQFVVNKYKDVEANNKLWLLLGFLILLIVLGASFYE